MSTTKPTFVYGISFCLILSNYFEINYIMFVLCIISMDYLGLILYIIIFTIKDLKFLIAPIITTTAMLVIFHFGWDLSPKITLYLSLISFVAILYIALVAAWSKIHTEYYLFAIVVFNLLKLGILYVIIIIIIIIIIPLILSIN